MILVLASPVLADVPRAAVVHVEGVVVHARIRDPELELVPGVVVRIRHQRHAVVAGDDVVAEDRVGNEPLGARIGGPRAVVRVGQRAALHERAGGEEHLEIAAVAAVEHGIAHDVVGTPLHDAERAVSGARHADVLEDVVERVAVVPHVAGNEAVLPGRERPLGEDVVEEAVFDAVALHRTPAARTGEDEVAENAVTAFPHRKPATGTDVDRREAVDRDVFPVVEFDAPAGSGPGELHALAAQIGDRLAGASGAGGRDRPDVFAGLELHRVAGNDFLVGAGDGLPRLLRGAGRVVAPHRREVESLRHGTVIRLIRQRRFREFDLDVGDLEDAPLIELDVAGEDAGRLRDLLLRRADEFDGERLIRLEIDVLAREDRVRRPVQLEDDRTLLHVLIRLQRGGDPVFHAFQERHITDRAQLIAAVLVALRFEHFDLADALAAGDAGADVPLFPAPAEEIGLVLHLERPDDGLLQRFHRIRRDRGERRAHQKGNVPESHRFFSLFLRQ